MSREQSIQNEIRNALAPHGLFFRANVGQGWTGHCERVTWRRTVFVEPGDVVIREPANPHDKNALAVLVARGRAGLGCASSKYDWVHVGYIPRDVAARLASKWPHMKGVPVIAEGTLVTPPAHERDPKIKLTGWRLYH